GRTGWLTPPGDHVALAQAMTALMQSSPEERRTMGNLARQHIAEQFGLDSVLDRWQQFYTELLQPSSQRNPQLDRPVAI
ncbi:MAG: hypothetical protein P4L03_09245, partial [Terracidiphilus sp.]|nr:hypothetical protein [Terracidiphilus sp.]